MDTQRLKHLTDRLDAGEITDSETEQLLALLEDDSPDSEMHALWSLSASTMRPDRGDRIWADITSQIDTRQAAGKPRLRRRLLAAAVMAGVIVMAALAGLWIGRATTANVAPQGKTAVAVDRGQKASMTLPDGTQVWLNSASSIAYDSRYGIDNRHLDLKGEAYFDVAKDPDRPFIVDAAGMTIKALGTKFNVKAYPADSIATATLAEGRLEVTTAAERLLLDPHDAATIQRSTGRLHKSTVGNLMLAEYWRTDKLVFAGERLDAICRSIERMYGVNITIRDRQLDDIRFTGTIRNNSLGNIFMLISLTYPIDYHIDGDSIRLEARK